MGVNQFIKMAKHQYFDLSYFCYSKLVEFYGELFGKDRVHVLFQEKLSANPEEFVAEFLRLAGARPPEKWDRGRARERSSPFAYAFLRIVNSPRHGPLNPMGMVYGEKLTKSVNLGAYALNRLYGLIPIFGKKVSLMSSKNRDFVWEYYKESNRDLAIITNTDLKALNYPL